VSLNFFKECKVFSCLKYKTLSHLLNIRGRFVWKSFFQLAGRLLFDEKIRKTVVLQPSSQSFKGKVRPDWICMRVVSLDRPYKGHQPLFFLFFIFDLEYLISVQSSEPLHAKMNPTSFLFGSRFACAQTVIFFAEPCFKMQEDINWSLDCGS
jgi:hypothetical protein